MYNFGLMLGMTDIDQLEITEWARGLVGLEGSVNQTCHLNLCMAKRGPEKQLALVNSSQEQSNLNALSHQQSFLP